MSDRKESRIWVITIFAVMHNPQIRGVYSSKWYFLILHVICCRLATVFPKSSYSGFRTKEELLVETCYFYGRRVTKQFSKRYYVTLNICLQLTQDYFTHTCCPMHHPASHQISNHSLRGRGLKKYFMYFLERG